MTDDRTPTIEVARNRIGCLCLFETNRFIMTGVLTGVSPSGKYADIRLIESGRVIRRKISRDKVQALPPYVTDYTFGGRKWPWWKAYKRARWGR